MEKGGKFNFKPNLSKKALNEKVLGEIITVCSRCGKELGRRTDYVNKGIEPISHSICEKCRKGTIDKEMEELKIRTSNERKQEGGEKFWFK